MNYQVNVNDGLININTLSSNGNYFYKIKPAKELNKSAYGCPIAFFDIFENLIYYRDGFFAHELHSLKEQMYLRQLVEKDEAQLHLTESFIKLVNWSRQGNVSYFLEYFDNGTAQFYESVFLDCKNNCCYRINENNDKWEFVNTYDTIESNFDEEIILEKLAHRKISREEVIRDNIKRGLSFLKKNKWYP